MFNKQYERRLEDWSEFRKSLEDSNDPFREVLDFYAQAPTVSIHTDPWTPTMWPNPWELVFENQYCDFCRVLGWCYSLQLTDRFKDSVFEIHIITNQQTSYQYLLFVDETVLGYIEDEIIHKHELPSNLRSHQVYPM